jgi:hypothetical protein
MHTASSHKRNHNWIGIGLWIILCVAVTVSVVKHPGVRTVTPNFWDASRHWINGETLYSDSGTGFLYFPQSAILQIPFALTHFVLAEILWRFLSIGLCAFACQQLAKQISTENNCFTLISLFTVPLLWSSARNGQMNVIVTALIVIGATLLARQKLKIAISLYTVGFALKPYLAVPILLISGVFPRRALPTAILGIILLAIFPFAFQSPQYVVEQYIACIDMLKISMSVGQELYYAYLFGMLKVFGLNIPSNAQLFISMFAGLSIFAFSVYLTQKVRVKPATPILMMLLSTAFILLFSSRTENNTYCLMGPFVGYLFQMVPTLRPTQKTLLQWLLLISYLAMLGSYEIGKHFSGSTKAVWLAPIGLIAFTALSIYVLTPHLREKYPLPEIESQNSSILS